MAKSQFQKTPTMTEPMIEQKNPLEYYLARTFTDYLKNQGKEDNPKQFEELTLEIQQDFNNTFITIYPAGLSEQKELIGNFLIDEENILISTDEKGNITEPMISHEQYQNLSDINKNQYRKMTPTDIIQRSKETEEEILDRLDEEEWDRLIEKTRPQLVRAAQQAKQEMRSLLNQPPQ